MSGEIRTQKTEVFVITDNVVRKIGNITQTSELGGEPARIDITNLDSVRRVSMPGLESDSRYTLTINIDKDSAHHAWLEDNKSTTTVHTVAICDSQGVAPPTVTSGSIDWPVDRVTRHFSARIATFQIGGTAPDGVQTASVGFDITDDVVRVDPA